MKQKGFEKYLGTSYEGYEKVVTRLLMTIEARRNQQGGGQSVRKWATGSGMRRSTELKGLVSFIN